MTREEIVEMLDQHVTRMTRAEIYEVLEQLEPPRPVKVKLRKGGVYRVLIDGEPEHVMVVDVVPNVPDLWHGCRVELLLDADSKVIFNPEAVEEIGDL